jgi:exonuclease SbcC
MIQKLKIQNFQSHKDTTLEFHSGVNVIVGASDSGKTAILRALRWLIWNRPNGEDFRSDWGGDTRISMSVSNLTSFESVDNSITIIREKGKENIYEILGIIDMGVKTLKAFGTSVPEEIQHALNIDSTNLQKQFDSPFLISSSPGEVAAYFNQVAHLEKIDSSVSYVNGKILNLNSALKASQLTLGEFHEELEKFSYIDKFEIDLEELEHQQSAQTQRISSRKRLSEHLHLMSTNEEMLKKQERITELEGPVDGILSLYREKREMREDMLTLKILLIGVAKKREEEEALRKKAELSPRVEALLKLHEEHQALCTKQKALRRALKEIKDIKQKQTAWETTLEAKEKQFHEHMPDLCPLCGSKTT